MNLAFHAKHGRGPAGRRVPLPLAPLTIILIGSGAVFFPRPAHAAAPTDLLEIRKIVVQQTNVPRLAKGCEPLKSSSRLTKAAQAHATDMAKKGYFSHTSKDGRTWDERIRQAGWDEPAAENIAQGYKAALAVVSGWMDSRVHRRNILNCDIRYIGVGYSADGRYWVQDFGY